MKASERGNKQWQFLFFFLCLSLSLSLLTLLSLSLSTSLYHHLSFSLCVSFFFFFSFYPSSYPPPPPLPPVFLFPFSISAYEQWFSCFYLRSSQFLLFSSFVFFLLLCSLSLSVFFLTVVTVLAFSQRCFLNKFQLFFYQDSFHMLTVLVTRKWKNFTLH